jgi:DNA-binding CsgD family transcriptional regulator/tetratricopeptide (TPR) repeat protein
MASSSTADRRTGRRRVIERPRLTRMLDETNARIILLTAPAGYGKTTLAQQWLAGRPNAWYRGTPASADVAALALGLAVAAAEIVPGADERLRERLRVTNHPDEETQILAELLAEDVANWPEGAWLAVDDYQFAMDSDAPESFVERFIELAPVRLLITSRNRPTWATARRILYAEIFELERNALAMDDQEAREMLEHRGENAPVLVERAAGWPAVIGLAALTEGTSPPRVDLPAKLYDYFAEEVYSQAEPAVRWGLCQLAIAPEITFELAERLFGNEAGALILDHGVRLGVLTGERPGPYVIHPLLRTFLDSKLREHETHAVKDVVSLLTGFVIERRLWDEAFAVIQRTGEGSRVVDLVEAGLDEMLEQGRLSTLERWLTFGRTQGIEAPVLDLAQAEIAFRQGAHVQALSLASHAASTLGSSHPFTARTLLRAGQSAHMSAREDLALTLHRRARDASRTVEEKVDAVHGELAAALDLELEDVDEIRRELEAIQAESPKSAMRLATIRVIMATRLGGLSEALEAAQSTLELAPMVKDPLARSAFHYVMSYSLGVAGRYRRALDLANLAIEEAERYRIDFALKHAYVSKAIAEVGLRHFSSANSLLREAETLARETSDTHVQRFSSAVRLRLMLAWRGSREPAPRVDLSPSAGVTKSMLGELIATLALFEACGGRLDQAIGLALQAEEVTVSSESAALVLWTRAVVEETRGSRSAVALASEAFATTSRLGCMDYFVCAYRGHPPLLDLLSQDVESRPRLVELLAEAQDVALAKRVGLEPLDIRTAGRSTLTKREREVHQLLVEGLSNREIAQALFISEATAKLHVRHILAKTGARNRTEAALRADVTKRR